MLKFELRFFDIITSRICTAPISADTRIYIPAHRLLTFNIESAPEAQLFSKLPILCVYVPFNLPQHSRNTSQRIALHYLNVSPHSLSIEWAKYYFQIWISRNGFKYSYWRLSISPLIPPIYIHPRSPMYLPSLRDRQYTNSTYTDANTAHWALYRGPDVCERYTHVEREHNTNIVNRKPHSEQCKFEYFSLINNIWLYW